MNEAIFICGAIFILSVTYAGAFCWGYVTGRDDERRNEDEKCR